MLGLVVTHAFGTWEKGDLIADPAFVDEVLASEHAERVVKVNVPDPVDTTAPRSRSAKKAP
ncbi:hypothetical protein AQ938_06980 [Burkholderia pseudomallei]|uniref:hypothetical protein n=1 Tax=Burkholderia pseudomallei TaxID=28450 RepID=UPI000055B58C|nr:hypothetical protein [Burkholderia pseudomallei]AJX61283.1 hypothetical protein DP47_3370 [Burkholderia pseudomallei Pasteur 52237]EDO95491.1 hypothetical protein BURPSPAST_C1334 [Burkholderia pseudomallei Pasteur 52237]MWA16591.1 hypothetical protein [Burkholderia pseudomallei]OND79016.1 hypothetical protein AQ938_06980 [Burkholderia pseudomallei]VBQ80887.1 Uncharacterised protein [Burkholderia pseudomallei]